LKAENGDKPQYQDDAGQPIISLSTTVMGIAGCKSADSGFETDTKIF
jgi:hypothetical protein